MKTRYNYTGMKRHRNKFSHVSSCHATCLSIVQQNCGARWTGTFSVKCLYWQMLWQQSKLLRAILQFDVLKVPGFCQLFLVGVLFDIERRWYSLISGISFPRVWTKIIFSEKNLFYSHHFSVQIDIYFKVTVSIEKHTGINYDDFLYTKLHLKHMKKSLTGD